MTVTAAPIAESIRILPRAVFVPEHSETAAQRFAFGYEIVIENGSDLPITLTDRHWMIDHGNGCLKEVRGEGVVGEQPRILPGERFSYRSGAVIESAAGRMWGDYGFVSNEGDAFRVTIPTFDLFAPAAFRSIQ
ncbi:Co2+/Mg2+ efflux protein ApaG [Guyparkeria halopsychrophila]|uniref:Co2+/Mg2+ efflux protein ApaG n=1 Tax=Guyparkeria halopsychrophila TaxID=3139421 RepID=UPI0037C624D5